MPYNHTQKELDVIQSAIRKGWHIIPYIPKQGDIKKKPVIQWGHDTGQEHLDNMVDVHWHGSLGRRMAFVLETANVALVDIDCAVPLYHDERNGRDYDDHRDDTHAIWDSISHNDKWQILTAIENQAIKAKLEPHASMPSSSRKGYHGYYRCKSRKSDPQAIRRQLTELSTGDPCVEFYCNWRLAYPSNWEEIGKLFTADPVSYEKVESYWSSVADKFNTYRILKRQADTAPPPVITKTASGTYTTDYLKLVENSPYAQIGKKCRLYVWLVKALQIGDDDGYQEGIRDAQMNGLSDAKIKVQADGARRTAARNPCRHFIRRQVYDNYTLGI